MTDHHAHVASLVQAIVKANRPRPLLKGVRPFIALIGGIPDSAVYERTPQALDSARPGRRDLRIRRTLE